MANKFMVTIMCTNLPNYPVTSHIPAGVTLYRTNGYHQDGYFKTSDSSSSRILILKSGIILVENGVHLSIIADAKKDIADFIRRYELTGLPRATVEEYQVPTF